MQAGELRIWNIAGLRPEIELRGHTGYVSCGAFHPDGTMLATGSGDKTVIVWSLAQKRVLKHDDVVRAVRFSPDGTLLAASDESGKIKLWRPLTGELVRTIDAHDLPVYNLAFSQDGQSLATCAGNWRTNSHGEVKFWEVTSGRLKGELEQNPNPQARPRAIWSIAFMPNSSLVATAGQDGVRIYDSISGKRERRLSSEPTRNIAFSPDGKLLAVVQNTDADPTIRLVDTANLQLCATLQGHKAMVFSVRFSPDGKTLASASKDATALIWNVPQEKSATAKK
jgi:WD40 repeat protein